MKKICILFGLATMVVIACFSQEAEATSNKIENRALIFPVEGKPGLYTRIDGTILNTVEALSQFSLFPKNKRVLEIYRGSAAVSMIGLGSAVALSVGTLYLELSGRGDQTLRASLLSASLVDFILSLIVAKQADDFRTKAMINYNFYIMGIPVR